MRPHHGVAGIVGLAGIATMASGGAYHDAPSTATQASPSTTQSTTQTIQSTAQSTTQTSPSVSTVHTNTTNTGDMATSLATPGSDNSTTDTNISNVDTNPTPVEETNASMKAEQNLNIERIVRKFRNDSNISVSSTHDISGSSSVDKVNVTAVKAESMVGFEGELIDNSTLDRRRWENVSTADDPPLISSEIEDTVRQRRAPRASPETDDLD